MTIFFLIFLTNNVQDDYGSAVLPELPGGQDLADLQGPGQRRDQDVRGPSTEVPYNSHISDIKLI